MKKNLVIMAAVGLALLLVFGAILLAGTASSAQAAAGVHTWTGAVDQDWSNSANWSPMVTPVYTDGMDCVLPAGAPHYPSVEFIGLQCGGILRIDSGARLDTSNVDFSMTDAQITGTWRLNGYVDLHGNHHKVAVNPGGLLYFDGLDGSGDNNNGTPSFDQNAFLISGTLRISGTATIYRDTNLFVAPSGLVDMQPGADLSIDDSGQLVNHGTLQQTKVVSGTTSFFMVNGVPSESYPPPPPTLKYAGVVITPTAGSLLTTTVRLKGDQTCAPGTVLRCFEIQPTNPMSATLRFYYLGSEADGNSAPNVYVLNGNQYDALPSTHGGSGSNLYAQGDGGSQYGNFVLKDSQPAARALLYLPLLY